MAADVHPSALSSKHEGLRPTQDLLAKLEGSGPRYTSYPTADRFVEAFGPQEYQLALRQRAEGAAVGRMQPLSVYVHIPFCESVCYYCACNKVVTKHRDRAAVYVDALQHEIEMHAEGLGVQQSVSQIHLGGGTPTYLSDPELERVMGLLRKAFNVAPGAETSIEVDPRTADTARLQRLATMGFNRISFGVQDFEPEVQKAVHREQPLEQVRDLIVAARDLGFESINADLIYGLPKQTPASFARTVKRMAELRPDRIALYAYAHLPQRFKPQRRIHTADLPSPQHRVEMLASALTGFVGSGYAYIGMDHFALPSDALAVAKRQGRLHRNFQGYSTQPDCDLIGLGVSAIGRVGATYSQNAKTLDEYYDALKQRQFPVVRGLALTRDDLLRRSVIMALMCQGRVDFESFDVAHLVRFKDYFKTELQELVSLEALNLVVLSNDGIDVTSLGWYFVRAVALVFDKHLRTDRARERFSRII